MNRFYAFKHWILTLIIAPLFLVAYQIYLAYPDVELKGIFEIYPVQLLFSILFSIPTFIIYYLIFSFLIREEFNPFFTKLILIGWTAFGITISLLILGGSLTEIFIYSYCISAIITGLLLPIFNTPKK